MIPGVPSLGGAELLILLAIILLFFGAKRLPQLGRSLGSGIREFRQGLAKADNNSEEDKDEHSHTKEAEEIASSPTEQNKP
jgi:sec-independent protein translocase protein TatA